MSEQKDITVLENVSGDKTFRNIKFASGVDRKTGKVVQGIDPGNHILLKKTYEKGFETKGFGEGQKSYSVKADLNGVEVSFFLKEEEHAVWETLGTVGDMIKVSTVAKPYDFVKDGKQIKGVSVKPLFELA